MVQSPWLTATLGRFRDSVNYEEERNAGFARPGGTQQDSRHAVTLVSVEPFEKLC